MKTQDYQEIIDGLLPSEIHTLDRMLESENRIGWINALEGISKLSKQKREERDSNVIGGLQVMRKDYKPISQGVRLKKMYVYLRDAWIC